MNIRKILPVLLLLISAAVSAQDDTSNRDIERILYEHIYKLTSKRMAGRGYTHMYGSFGRREHRDGNIVASDYIAATFAEDGLEKCPGNDGYLQRFEFPVNRFPTRMELRLDNLKLHPGRDYLIDAASASYSDESPVRIAYLSFLQTAATRDSLFATFDTTSIWILRDIDSLCKNTDITAAEVIKSLPRGCFIIPQRQKLMWTVSREQMKATVFYVQERTVREIVENVIVDVYADLQASYAATNVIGMVPGAVKDSYVVFTGHYDHLGMMGYKTVFPGASDNASGTAMLLYLAGYYARHPQKYTMVFIAFGGEEAGLLGSAYFVKHPLIPLENIKFLTNIDIMGDATDGITVVNATERPAEFSLLNRINNEKKYLPVIKSKGKAANSDHYYFSEAGVPSIFIYSNGGKGYYHDIYDKPGRVMLTNVTGVAGLLIDFTGQLR